MTRRPKTDERTQSEAAAPRPREKRHPDDASGDASFRFEDRRHWARAVEPSEEQGEPAEAAARPPTVLDEYRDRAEQAEAKLQEYIEAFKRFKSEQEEVRVRLARDVERKVELLFGNLVAELLETIDNLDLALEHVREVPEAEALARGVELARKRFRDTLEAHGVQQLAPLGDEFDPHQAEAVRVDPVETPERDGKVTEVLRCGYRLGDRVIRAARVAVGRHGAG